MTTISQQQPSPQPPKKPLLERMRDALRARHYSIRTETSYLDWARRFILFHHKRHPETMGASEVTAFLTHLAVEKNVAASTQTQALSAILFLYRSVLQMDIDEPLDIVRAKKPEHLPVVLGKDEVQAVLRQMSGDPQLTPALAAQVQVWPNSSTVAACA